MPGLDALPQDLVQTMKTKAQRYPVRSEGLMEDPFAYDVPKDKKKKKKWVATHHLEPIKQIITNFLIFHLIPLFKI